MKLLTLNAHSHAEENYSVKLNSFILSTAEEKPDIIAFQEANQTISENTVSGQPDGYTPCSNKAVIRGDNHILMTAEMLRRRGLEYYWTWLPLKKGYDKYEEGIGLMSRSKILGTDILQISRADDYNNWKTRKIVGIRTEASPDEWFFSVHYGWWNDPEEPFREQWLKTTEYMKNFRRVWLMGDFNNPSELRGEGYDLIKSGGWYDSFMLADSKDSGITVGKLIDGWKDKIHSTSGMRIDHIWCSEKVKVNSSKVIFNGINGPVVSDHYGVIINY